MPFSRSTTFALVFALLATASVAMAIPARPGYTAVAMPIHTLPRVVVHGRISHPGALPVPVPTAAPAAAAISPPAATPGR